jgi:hypothetical protein
MSNLVPTSQTTPGLVNIVVYRAQDNVREFSGLNFTLTERYTDFRCEVRQNANSSSRLLLRKDMDNGITINSGKAYITWAVEDFEDIEAGIYWFDLFALKENGFTIALCRGRFEIVGNITQEENE